MQEKIHFAGWNDCIRLRNAGLELIVTTRVGPRIVHFGFTGEQNLLYLSPGDAGKTGGADWRIYGGHRLWHAPEARPRSYCPDNDPVVYACNDHSVKLVQETEPGTGIVKEMEISLSEQKNEVSVLHRLTNGNAWDIELSPWAISVMAPGGLAIVPQEPFGEGNDYLLPARPLALWQYTKMNDTRWIWGDRYILARQDPAKTSEQKIGVLNKPGWAAYLLNGSLFIKRFAYDPAAVYPDFGCNNEIYINGSFLEIESLGPLVKLAPQQSIGHTERWLLFRTAAKENEASIHEHILPIIERQK